MEDIIWMISNLTVEFGLNCWIKSK